MANQITDNRTLLFDGGDGTGGAPDDLTGAASGTIDNEIFIEGANSYGYYTSNTRAGLMFDAGSAQDWSNNVFYLWVNCGIVGLLATQANGGMTVRFSANTTPASNYKEYSVGGSNNWPSAVSGGWVQFVVDIEDSNTFATAGTLNTNAVRYVGVSSITGGTMPRMVDNTWLDAIWRLPDGNPGIVVEGRNGGSTDWDWDDVESTSTSGAWGTCRPGPGGALVLNTPVQFGISDTTTHAFTDSNRILLWDNQLYAPSDLYGFSALGNSGGTTNVTWGVKTGTGNAATGAQGLTVSAATTGVRWSMDFDDPDIDGINLYGCTFIHGGDFQLDDAAVSLISSAYVDCTSTTISASEQLRASIIDANTADSVAFMTTSDLADIVNSSFEFSDGHGIEITSTAGSPFSFVGNSFTGYGGTPGTNLTPSSGSTDAAIYNSSGGAITINVTGGDTPSIRNAASSTTTVNNNNSLDIHVQDAATAAIQSAQVAVYNSSDDSQLVNVQTDASGDISTASIANGTSIYVRVRKSTTGTRYFPLETVATINADTSLTITLTEDTIAS